MDKFDKRTYEIIKRLQNARLNLLSKQPFYALLLLHMKFSLDMTCETAYTDGDRIAFNPDFLDALSDKELEFVLMHEALHAALGHPFRRQSDYDLECYDKACDIVVNSNILYSFNMNISSITLKNFGVAMHKTPSGKEGYECTVEEVYDELIKLFGKTKKNKNKINDYEDADNNMAEDANETEDTDDEFDDADDDAENTEDADEEENSDDNSEISQAQSTPGGKGGKNDSKTSKKGKGQNENKNNSLGSKVPHNEYDTSGYGEKWKDPNEYDLESLINQLKVKNQELSQKYSKELIETKKAPTDEMIEPIDDHSFWEGDDECNSKRTEWENYVMQSAELVESTMEKENAHKGYGGPPLCAKRLVKELTHPDVDWRTVLNEFIQEEINDYSFAPPDKRLDDCPFFLPDFNVKDERVKNVWFLIDTSGSIGDKQIAAAYSEIISAIDMFNGKLEGLLSFTEVFVTEPIAFCTIEELLEIKPVGGGGNDFSEIFRYMQRNMMDDLPTSIVIFTDGYDFYPPETEALGIPVFWLINNQEAEPPPWGRWARFKVNE